MPPIQSTAETHYARLEQGARHLAALAIDESERREHLGWANRYCRLRLDAAAPAMAG